jgi:transcriptional regulator with XRE-family HTH domain
VVIARTNLARASRASGSDEKVFVRSNAKRAGAGVRQRMPWVRFQVGDEERTHLAEGFGATLRTARCTAGMSRRQLARLIGCADSTVSRLERGLRRPRPSMIASLCAVLDPKSLGLKAHLVELAGESLRPDTRAGARRRRRRIGRALREAWK